MPDHMIGTREQWQAARDELAELEAEQAELERKVVERRRELPWVPVEKEYVFDTEHGKQSPSSSRDAPSCWPTTSCSGPTTRSAPAPGARTSATSSTQRACIWAIAT